MKFSVQSKALYTAASSVSKIINPKNTLMILENFLVELKGDTLTITGSDTENALSAKVEVKQAEGDGRVCLPARRLVELLKEIPDQGLEVTIDQNTMLVDIEYTSGRFNMVALSGDQYPEYRTQEEAGVEPFEFVMPSEYLHKGLEYTMFAVGDDDYRPMMMGVLLDVKPESVTFVATDTRKLVRYIDNRVKSGNTARVILPVKPAAVFRSVFAKDGEIRVTIGPKNARIESATMSMQCSFINGVYPDYNRVIPQNQPYHLTTDRVAFHTAVRRVGVFVDSSFSLEKFKITSERIVIKADDPNLCTSARDSVPCSFDGPELIIGFSAQFLGDILSTIPTEEVHAELADPGRPGVFLPSENEEGTDLVMLIMPMTVNEF